MYKTLKAEESKAVGGNAPQNSRVSYGIATGTELGNAGTKNDGHGCKVPLCELWGAPLEGKAKGYRGGNAQNKFKPVDR